MKRPKFGGTPAPETEEEQWAARKQRAERVMKGHDQKKSKARRFAWGRDYDQVSVIARHRTSTSKKLARDNF